MVRVCSRFSIGVLGVCACVLLAGCSKSHGWSVIGGGELGYQIELLRCDGRVFLVLAADGCAGGASSGGGNGSFSGEFWAIDGRKIAWSCSTRDAARGTVTIDGQKLDLGEGAVLLVRTNEPKTKVEHVAVEMSKVQYLAMTEHPIMDLRPLADSDPRIGEFFKKSDPEP